MEATIEFSKCFDSSKYSSSSSETFEECQYEAAYCWFASERTKTAIIGGPSSLLKFPDYVASGDATSSDDEEGPGLPSHARSFWIGYSRSMELGQCDIINNQHSFRNPSHPLEVALTSIIVCCLRWGPERDRLRGRTSGSPATAKEPASVDSIISNPSLLRECAGAKRLREFDVIASRRVLRFFLRHLFADSSPHQYDFDVDVDLIGKTLILTAMTGDIKSRPTGYGMDFEKRFVERAALNTAAVPPSERMEAGDEQTLTTMYVVRSMLLFGVLKIAISAEVDALAPQFFLALHAVPFESTCSRNKKGDARNCAVTKHKIGSNNLLVHSCRQLSMLEEQLIQDSVALVELKSHSQFRPFGWEDTADQMLMAGVKLLFKSCHCRGKITSLELHPFESVKKNAQAEVSTRTKWATLVSLLEKIREAAERARGENDVGCIRLRLDGSGESLLVEERRRETVHLSPEAVSWLL